MIYQIENNSNETVGLIEVDKAITETTVQRMWQNIYQNGWVESDDSMLLKELLKKLGTTAKRVFVTIIIP